MEAEVDADAPASLPDPASLPAADGDALERAAELLRGAERPVVMAGTGPVLGARRRASCRRSARELQIPVFLNGLARGCVPADHPQFFSRARGTGLKGADVALVVGVPMDFRLGFGGSFGDDTRADRDRVGAAGARAPAPGGRRAVRERGRLARGAALGRGRRAGPLGAGRTSCARSRTRSARPSRRT